MIKFSAMGEEKIGKHISHYKILKKLGKGGMGVVYKAEDTRLHRTVALKFLPSHVTEDSDIKARFLQEAQAASALDHLNIATIYAIEEAEGECFIAMAYVEGETLKERIKSGPLDVEEVLNIAISIAEGLAEAHSKGIIHRDIKSDNIMITPTGQVKITDFGLAKFKDSSVVTKEGTVLGTPAYMSPEQAQCEKVDHRTDIFSLGIVLYEMITGRLPFIGDKDLAIIYSIVHQEPQPVGEIALHIPKELERIVGKALKKDAEERYQTIDAMLMDLKKLRGEAIAFRRKVRVFANIIRRKPILKILYPVAFLMLIGIFLLLSQKFKIRFTEETAIAEENSLAVMYFDNLQDPNDANRLGEMITNLLITDLSESRYLQVVSSQRLYDILKQMDREGQRVVNKTVATKVAKRARVKTMLTGSVGQLDSRLFLTTQLVDVANGRIIDSQRVDGTDIYAMVDELTVKVKEDLGLPASALFERDIPVADVTTRSLEAYRYYLKGLEKYMKAYDLEAVDDFTRAVAIDSGFAMAHFWLYYLYGDLEDQKASQASLKRAVEYSQRATPKERFYIAAANAKEPDKKISILKRLIERYPNEKLAHYQLAFLYREAGDNQRAISEFKQAIKLDPKFHTAYNQLGYTYARIGEYEKAVETMKKYISLRPEDPNPYDSLGDIYRYQTDYENALINYQKAEQIRPGFSTKHLGQTYFALGDYDAAIREYEKRLLSAPKGKRWEAYGYLGGAYLAKGMYEKAVECNYMAVGASIDIGSKVRAYFTLGAIYYDRGDLDRAMRNFERAGELYSKLSPEARHRYKPWPQMGKALVYIQWNQYGEAEEEIAVVRELIESFKREDVKSMLYYLNGEMAYAQGHYDEAAENFIEGSMFLVAEGDYPIYQEGFVYRAMAGKAYLKKGDLDKAIEQFREVLRRFPRRAKAHYHLAQAYERKGLEKKAVEHYQTFLEIWRDADEGLPEVEDARGRLERLKV